MSIQLKVTPEALKTKASEVSDQIRELRNCFNTIEDTVKKSSVYWVGNAGNRARKEFDSQKDDIQVIIKRFSEHPPELLQMAGIYIAAETEIKSNNDSLDADVIA